LAVVKAWLRCFQLARQQGSDWHAAGAAISAAILSTSVVSQESTGAVRAAVAAFQEAEPELRRCKGLLPLLWLAELQYSYPAAKSSCAACRGCCSSRAAPALPTLTQHSARF